MPRIGKNSSPTVLKEQSSPPLSTTDLPTLRTFVNQRLNSPTARQDNGISLGKVIEQNPAAYEQAVDLLGAGHSVQSVASSTGLALETVKAASWFVPNYREICRASTSRNLAAASLRMSEVLVQNADQIDPNKLAFTLSVAVEKAELLSGGVSARVEHRQVVTREELQKLFDALPRAKDVKVIGQPTKTQNNHS